jgi:D-amino peptidase
MKIYIVTDLEGTSGVGSFDVHDPHSPQDAARRARWLELWAEEVNAAVMGALDAGATEIVVVDNHSSGDSLAISQLHASVRLVHGGARPTWLPLLDASYAAVIIIGQHAMAGDRSGHLRHTYSRRRLEWVRLNGDEIGEAGLIAGIAGEHNLPVVCLTGDDRAVDEFITLAPAAVGVAVKQSLSKRACVSLPLTECRERIRAGTAAALARRHEIPPVRFAVPMSLRVRYHRRDAWRAPARWLHSGTRLGWHGGRDLHLRGDCLQVLWDRFIGLSR